LPESKCGFVCGLGDGGASIIRKSMLRMRIYHNPVSGVILSGAKNL
jgi:hypothetical protein